MHHAPFAMPLILLYIFDSLRPDFLGCYGDRAALTPHLDEFAARATRYESAYAAAPWSKPSGAALLTGRLPRAIRMTQLLDPLPPDVPTLAEAVGRAGWHTVAVSGNPFISHDFGLLRGFDEMVEAFRPDVMPQEPFRFHRNHFRRLSTALSVPPEALVLPRSAALHRALLDHLGDDAPTFALCWSMDSHAPFFVRGERSHFGNPLDRVIPAADEEWLRDGLTVAEMVRLYRDMIAYNDAEFGWLMAELKARGRWEEALIVVAADHGEAFGEHGHLGHTHGLWEEQLRVPLLVKFPQQRAGARRADVVSLLDLWPTVRFALPHDAPDPDWAVPLPRESQAPAPPRPLLFDAPDRWAMRRGPWKLHGPTSEAQPLLFNLESDPAERRPLVEGPLQRALWDEADALMARADAEATGWTRAAPVDLADLRARLRHLGYL